MTNPRTITTVLLLLIGLTSAWAADHASHGGAVPATERELFHPSPIRPARLITDQPGRSFPITTRSARAQAFFDQGLAMFHADWPQEAERAFLTALRHDPDAFLPHWGIALTHLVRDPWGAVPSLVNLQSRRELAAALKPSERALLRLLPPTIAIETNANWRPLLIRRLRAGMARNETHDEMRALLITLLCGPWHARLGDLGESRDTVLALLDDARAADPTHPVLRSGLRLWANELRHDPYHTPAKYFAPDSLRLDPAVPFHWGLLGRYLAERGKFAEAIQLSAVATRSYHQWATLNQVPPDRLPDYARSRLVQGAQHLATGDAETALAIARELLRQPRHPRWNNVTNRFGSAYAGRRLFLDAAFTCGRWEELAAQLSSWRDALPTDPVLKAEHEFARAATSHFLERREEFTAAARRLRTIHSAVAGEFQERQPETNEDAHHGSMLAWLLDGGEDYLSVKDWHRSVQALERARQGDTDRAARMLAGSRRVHPLLRARLLWSIGRQREAGQALLNTTGLALPLRVKAMQMAAQSPATFPLTFSPQPGAPPQLSTWQPQHFPDVAIPLLDGSRLDARTLRGRHTLLIFIYSSNCEHCVDQLAAVRKQAAAIRAADLDVVVIAGQPAASLSAWLQTQPPYPARFGADPDEQWFPRAGAYDEFNDLPLHATIYLDPTGRELWRDVGHEPFMDIDFLIQETLRFRSAYPTTPAD